MQNNDLPITNKENIITRPINSHKSLIKPKHQRHTSNPIIFMNNTNIDNELQDENSLNKTKSNATKQLMTKTNSKLVFKRNPKIKKIYPYPANHLNYLNFENNSFFNPKTIIPTKSRNDISLNQNQKNDTKKNTFYERIGLNTKYEATLKRQKKRLLKNSCSFPNIFDQLNPEIIKDNNETANNNLPRDENELTNLGKKIDFMVNLSPGYKHRSLRQKEKLKNLIEHKMHNNVLSKTDVCGNINVMSEAKLKIKILKNYITNSINLENKGPFNTTLSQYPSRKTYSNLNSSLLSPKSNLSLTRQNLKYQEKSSLHLNKKKSCLPQLKKRRNVSID